MMIVKRGSKAVRWMGLILGLSVALLIGLPAQAFHFPWDQGHDTTDWDDPIPPGPCEGPLCTPCGSTGSPVYLPTGHFLWRDTDINIVGRPSLMLKRSYNSNDPRDGIFGNGWTSNCEDALFIAQSNEDNVEATIFWLRLADGKRYQFSQQSDGSVVSPPGRYEQLTTNADNTVTLTEPNGATKNVRCHRQVAHANRPQWPVINL